MGNTKRHRISITRTIREFVEQPSRKEAIAFLWLRLLTNPVNALLAMAINKPKYIMMSIVSASFEE